MTDSDKDELLLEKARGGSKESFLALYQRHRDPIFRFLYRFLGSAAIAEDITHDSFASLIRDSQRLPSSAPTSIRTQLYVTARSRAVEYLARIERDTNNVEVTPRTRETKKPSLDGDIVSQVAEAVAGLPPLEREALVLSEYEGLELLEIAEIVGADMRTVATRLDTARQRLRNNLANYLAS